MNFSMFFEFPGILILIGVVLLILAIVIGIIAYKSPNNLDLEEEITENLKEQENLDEIPNIENEELSEETKQINENDIKEVELEETEPLEEQKQDEFKEEYVEDNLVVEEKKEETENISEPIVKEQEALEQEFIQGDTNESDFIENEFNVDDYVNKHDAEEISEDKIIYGGANPIKDIKFDSIGETKEPYTENISNIQETEELINALNSIPLTVKKEEFNVKENIEEEIELL